MGAGCDQKLFETWIDLTRNALSARIELTLEQRTAAMEEHPHQGGCGGVPLDIAADLQSRLECQELGEPIQGEHIMKGVTKEQREAFILALRKYI